MRRSLAAVALALVLCAGSAGAAPGVSLEFWTISLQPLFTGYMQRLIARYQQLHPDVSVRWIDVQPQAVDQKLLASIAGGISPDVVNLNTESTVRMAQQGALVDMDAAVPPAARAAYFPNIWSSLRYQGRSYGVPWYVVPDVLAYSRTLFVRAGLDPSHPPRTTEEFGADAVTIKARTGVYGFMPNVDGTRMLALFQEEGLPVLSADRTHALFAGPAYVALLAKYVDLYKRDMFPDDTLQHGYLGATERYSGARLAMLTTGPQFLLRVKTDSPDVYRDTLVAPAPLGAGHVLDLPTMALTVPQASRHRDAAVAFALFVTDDENQLAFDHEVVIFPSTRRAAADPFFTQSGGTPEDRARAIAARELGIARDLTVVVPDSDELFRDFRDAVESAFYGRMTPAQALAQAAQEWNARL